MYRDQVARVTLAQVRAQFPPRVSRTLPSVQLQHGGVECTAAIAAKEGVGCIAGLRRWFRCPRCEALVAVLGCVDGVWGCRKCLGWRSRNRRRTTEHLVSRLVAATEACTPDL